MNLQSVLKSLGDVDGEFPEEAMAWALEHWDTTRGALTQVLARCAKQLDEAPDADYAIALYAIHMLAEKREKQIFPLICALAKSPDGLAEVLGESAMWTGSAILISLFDGDAKALRDMATPDAPDQILAACALEAMAYLTMTGEIAREETVEHFTRVLALKNDDPMHIAVWDSWARGVAMLAIDELMPRLREALAVEGEGAGEIDTSDLDVLFRLAKEDPPGVFARENIAPLDDAIQALLRFEREMAEAMEEEGGLYGDGDDREAPAAPAENPFRGVGRNDPCPCGSGKKFKKCCLAA